MKRSKYKQNLYDKEVRRHKRIDRMTEEQKKEYTTHLLNRNQKKSETRDRLIQIISSEPNLALKDIQEKLGIKSRNTFNYWIDLFEKENWFKRKNLDLIGEDKRGNPKTLVLNKEKMKERIQYSYRRYKEGQQFEEYNLNFILAQKILREIEKQQHSDKQHQRLIEMFKQFRKEGFGAKLMFLMYDDFIKIDYKLSLTEKGEKALKKLKKKKLTR